MTLVAGCLKTKGCVALLVKKQTAAPIMSSPAITPSLNRAVQDIAALFTARKINRPPPRAGEMGGEPQAPQSG